MDEDSKPPEEGFYLRSNRLGMKLQSITEIIGDACQWLPSPPAVFII